MVCVAYGVGISVSPRGSLFHPGRWSSVLGFSMVSREKEGFRSPGGSVRAAKPAAVLDASRPGAWKKVGGIPLAARSLFHLGKLGTGKALLLLGERTQDVDLRPWQTGLELIPVRVTTSIPETVLSVADPGQVFLYIDASHLIDPRLMGVLASASKSTLAFFDPEDRKRQVVRAGLLQAGDLGVWAREGTNTLIRGVEPLFPGDIDPYCAEIRGTLTPYFMEVHTEGEARNATRVLIRSQQKKVMDFPAQFIDPPFENLLTRLLCETRATPNMVTYAGVTAAAGVAYLFWHGHFVAGALLGFLVEILDGVDGKLARTKLVYSKLGQQEAIIDYFCENSWYVALGVGLSGYAGGPIPGLLAGLLIFSDTLDNVLYTLAAKWYGMSIDLFTRFDASFRRIAGRRNIYGMMFIVGFSVGLPLHTFAAAAFWAALTASIHGFRLIHHGKVVRKRIIAQQVERV
jgi:phosphatidylglycerophosphate synthase